MLKIIITNTYSLWLNSLDQIFGIKKNISKESNNNSLTLYRPLQFCRILHTSMINYWQKSSIQFRQMGNELHLKGISKGYIEGGELESVFLSQWNQNQFFSRIMMPPLFWCRSKTTGFRRIFNLPHFLKTLGSLPQLFLIVHADWLQTPLVVNI